MQKIGIIGFGNMGSAIAEGIKKDYPVIVFDKDKSKTAKISGIKLAQNNIDIVKSSDIVILAVKPQDFEKLLEEIKGVVEDKLIVSIAAGITTSYIETRLDKARVIRVMPNLPAKVRKGMICLSRGSFAHEDELNLAKALFDYLGKTLLIEENQMNAATAVSGSGPGFLYDQIQGKTKEEIKDYIVSFTTSLTNSAINIGFSKPVAEVLAQTTASGSIAYLEQMHLSPEEAKKQVASKGGTTEAGLEVLHKGGSLSEAVKAALRRAQELSKS
ncbi:MAG: hypothetical protein A2166_04825 [Omnitrophica WOR_2 bacterium RBG_13_41_10]|nr:MAG: hypothetical protein A2166_04825 [Omnitrophica WOR_2 bacterium RBG_13_41_10]